MMFSENIAISDPKELIERLKSKQDVLGILQYGSGIWPDAADTDLCVVVSRRPEGLESAHFWLKCGPVDLNVRTLDELKSGGVADLPGFDDVLREGKVLYEREAGLLGDIVGKGCPSPSQPSPQNLAGMRHGHTHVLTKLEHYKDRNPLLCNVLLAGATHWLLGAYAAARGLAYRGEKATLKAIRENDSDLLANLDQLASEATPLAERIEALRRLTNKVLEPIGGPWQKGEVLFFAESEKSQRKPQQWNSFLKSLLNFEDSGIGVPCDETE